MLVAKARHVEQPRASPAEAHRAASARHPDTERLGIQVSRASRANWPVNTTASGWSSAKSATSATLRVTCRAARQPACNGACDHEPYGDETVVEVTLRPPATASWFPLAFGPRGENAAHVRRRRTRSSRERPRRDDANRGTVCPHSDRGRARP